LAAGSRSALVTGAASGIGRALAERLVKDGFRVLAVDIRPDEGGPGEQFEADLTTREGNRAAVKAARQRFGGLDVVVANAGYQHVAPVNEFSEEEWDSLVALLLTSPFLLAKYSWEALKASGSGRFIAIASAHGLTASPFKAGYVSAKHGVVGLVKVLGLEGAEHGIASAAVCPAYVRTPLVERQIKAQAVAHDLPESRVLEEVILERQAIKRLIEPDEVADIVSLLAGPHGELFTGTAVPIDLGWTAR
jgi:3-hydroxybutyrate dehydrogenase